MSEDVRERWAAVDDYLTALFAPPDPSLDAALAAVAEAGMPMSLVAPNQGRLLEVLALAGGARAILEIGTLAEYSTIWLARPSGRGRYRGHAGSQPHARTGGARQPGARWTG